VGTNFLGQRGVRVAGENLDLSRYSHKVAVSVARP
jgi:hypothetical protein